MHFSFSPRELFGDANTGINFDRYEDIPVEATGEGCPKNVTSFEDCGFHETVRENIRVCVCGQLRKHFHPFRRLRANANLKSFNNVLYSATL